MLFNFSFMSFLFQWSSENQFMVYNGSLRLTSDVTISEICFLQSGEVMEKMVPQDGTLSASSTDARAGLVYFGLMI